MKKLRENQYVNARIGDEIILGKIEKINSDNATISDGNHLYDVPFRDVSPTDFKSERESKYEMVDHPNHYHPGDYEAIKVIKAWLCDEGCYNFCIANSINYISRLGFKPDSGISKEGKLIEDIDKAIWYLEYAKECKLK